MDVRDWGSDMVSTAHQWYAYLNPDPDHCSVWQLWRLWYAWVILLGLIHLDSRLTLSDALASGSQCQIILFSSVSILLSRSSMPSLSSPSSTSIKVCGIHIALFGVMVRSCHPTTSTRTSPSVECALMPIQYASFLIGHIDKFDNEF